MNNILTWLNGKKTYAVVIAAIGLVAAQLLGYTVPSVAWELLGATALATLRMAIASAQKRLADLASAIPPEAK